MYRVLYFNYGGYGNLRFATDTDGDVRKFDTADEALEWQLVDGYHQDFRVVKMVLFQEAE